MGREEEERGGGRQRTARPGNIAPREIDGLPDSVGEQAPTSMSRNRGPMTDVVGTAESSEGRAGPAGASA